MKENDELGLNIHVYFTFFFLLSLLKGLHFIGWIRLNVVVFVVCMIVFVYRFGGFVYVK